MTPAFSGRFPWRADADGENDGNQDDRRHLARDREGNEQTRGERDEWPRCPTPSERDEHREHTAECHHRVTARSDPADGLSSRRMDGKEKRGHDGRLAGPASGQAPDRERGQQVQDQRDRMERYGLRAPARDLRLRDEHRPDDRTVQVARRRGTITERDRRFERGTGKRELTRSSENLGVVVELERQSKGPTPGRRRDGDQ